MNKNNCETCRHIIYWVSMTGDDMTYNCDYDGRNCETQEELMNNCPLKILEEIEKL